MSDILSQPISDYLLEHCTGADELLRELAEETHRSLGSRAGMEISHDEGVLLGMLVRLAGARNAVEVGVFTGYSSICIARALAPGGSLLACDVSEEWTSVARRYWARAGLTDTIELRLAPAAETLRALPAQENIDFSFIDADKVGYPVYYEELVTRTRPGGLLVLDNVLWSGRVVDPACQDESDVALRTVNDLVTADERVESVMLPVRDGMTIVRKR